MRYLFIDGSAFVWRAYSVCASRLHEGRPVGALNGFITALLRPLVERSAEERVCIVFDAPGPSFRHSIYPAYKANRPPPPEDLVAQIPLMREAAAAYGLPVLEVPGVEADDVLATLAVLARNEDGDVVVTTGDKDMMQIVREGVCLFDRQKRIMIREKEVVEAFGVAPSKVVDCQALAGDSADNVPGVRGIGPKIAARLLAEFGSLEEIYGNLEAVNPGRTRAALEEHRDMAFLSRRLVRLADNVDLGIALEEFEMRPPCPPDAFLKAYGLPSGLAPRFSRRFPDWRP